VYSATPNQEQAALFNLANTAGSNGSMAGERAVGGSTSAAGYFVDLEGYIQMPVIGRIKAAGLTIPALRDTLQARLAPYVKSPPKYSHLPAFNPVSSNNSRWAVCCGCSLSG
jgi:polysaccharide export outer membrane protein